MFLSIESCYLLVNISLNTLDLRLLQTAVGGVQARSLCPQEMKSNTRDGKQPACQKTIILACRSNQKEKESVSQAIMSDSLRPHGL